MSLECPVFALGGAGWGKGGEPDVDEEGLEPSGCGSILIETEKSFVVYSSGNLYGAAHDGQSAVCAGCQFKGKARRSL